MKALLLLILAAAGNHWVKIKDSYKTHRLYVTHYGNEIGGYYQPFPNSFERNPKPVPFTAQCYAGKPAELATEQEAIDFVIACPQ